MAIAGFCAGMLISVAANAVYKVEKMPAIQSGFASDMADWIANAEKYSWNPANVRQGTHPDRPDGVVYIFLDEKDAEEWWPLGADPTAPMPTDIPKKAVAYMHWALDNDSGLFPGIMAISDDPDFKKKNCIMASGKTIPFDVDNKTGEPLPPTDKKCGNGQGTAKRFKLVILQADQPIDLIFNTTNTTFSTTDAVNTAGELTDLVYDNYVAADVIDNIFRNYRYIMKVGNGTGTNVGPEGARVERVGTRLAGIKVELGSPDSITGLINPIDGLTFELEECIADPYFDVPDVSAPKGTCVSGEVQVWQEEEFATISPAMYAVVGDDRNPEGGYWGKQPAGIYPPKTQTANVIDSGTETTVTDQTGAITNNYFDVAKYNEDAPSALLTDRIMFGYLMHFGIFAEGDPGLIPMGIYKDDDGDPATEGGLYAWWDGTSPTCCYRWGIDKDDNGLVGPNAWGTLSDGELAYIAARELENTTLLPPHYEIAYADDLGGLNMDTYIKITPDYNPDPLTGNPTFTVRLTGQSIAAAKVADGAPGTADGTWVATPAMEFADFPEATPVDPEPEDPPVVNNSDGDDGLFGLSWVVVGMFAFGLLLRRRRF
jgi:hypothetical protein